MKILFIDTHLYDIDIILFNDKKIIKQGHVEKEKYNSTFLIPTLKNVIENESFDEVVVVNGPGSFTGVRLGVTVAKTLAYTMNKNIRQISYFDLMNFSSDSSDHTFGISDGNGYFIATYNNHKLIGEYKYINNQEYKEIVQNKKVETDVSIDYDRVLDSLENIPYVNPHEVKPIYIKLIGVEQ